MLVPPKATTLFHRLSSISIVGGFLDGATFEFADGLNCLIGARGTGKTTALEFVRYALDLLPGRDADPAERKRIELLVERNLGGGRINVEIETKEGLRYVVSRSAGEEPVVLTPQGEPTNLTLRCGGVFKADVYSQNEVEGIADRAQSQLSLIDNFATEKIVAIDVDLRKVQSLLATNAEQIVPLREKYDALGEEIATLPGVEAKLKEFATEPGGSGEAIDRAHADKALRDREQRACGVLRQELEEFRETLGGLAGHLGQQVNLHFRQDLVTGPNGTLLVEVRDGLASCAQEVDDLLQTACRRLATERQQLDGNIASLSAAHARQELTFRSLLEKHQEAQGQATERSRLEKLRNELLAKRAARDAAMDKLTQLFLQRQSNLRRLSELRDQRFAVREQVAAMINAHLSPAIRVQVIQYGNPAPYQRMLEEALKGARLKQNLVAERIVSAFWPADLSEAVKRGDAKSLMDKAELSRDQAEKVLNALNGFKTLFQLETVELHDLPRIELRDGDVYKDSTVLSTGQKCTAILPILLLDSANPLLVDQPEDNLDNRFIFEAVVDSIRKNKARRQLIFVTHNPNIPVLGDAERVFVLDSDGTIGRKANEGTVDECKDNIVTLLEGGEDAFKARKQRYAY